MYNKLLEIAKGITDSYRERYWAAADAVNKGTPPPPAAPNYAEANREGIMADIRTLPARKAIEAAAKMGGHGSITVGGETISYDFRGISDLDQQVTNLEAYRQSADSMAQTALDIQKKYGADFADQALKRIEESDPVGFKVRRRLAEMTLSELEKGTQLSDEEVKFAEQAFRRSSAARGGPMLGTAPAIQETLSQYNMGRQLLTQRMNMARSYVGQPQTAQFGQVAGAQQGAAPMMGQGLGAGIGLNANAGAQATSFASNIFGTQAQIYGTQMANQSDPFGAVLGGVASIGMAGLTGGIGSSIAGAAGAGKFAQGFGGALMGK